MPASRRPLDIPLPRGWPRRVRSAVVHTISLARTSVTHTRSWAANHYNARIRLKEVNELLGVPEKGWNFHACVTFGYPTGKWGVAPRVAVHKVMHRNKWGESIGFEAQHPLWPRG